VFAGIEAGITDVRSATGMLYWKPLSVPSAKVNRLWDAGRRSAANALSPPMPILRSLQAGLCQRRLVRRAGTATAPSPQAEDPQGRLARAALGPATAQPRRAVALQDGSNGGRG
jgi:hypothetical protein